MSVDSRGANSTRNSFGVYGFRRWIEREVKEKVASRIMSVAVSVVAAAVAVAESSGRRRVASAVKGEEASRNKQGVP